VLASVKILFSTMAMSVSGRVYADMEVFFTSFFQSKDKCSFFLQKGFGLNFKASENVLFVATKSQPRT
jgi:hypothetical protein